MESEYFLNAGMHPHPLLHYLEQSSSAAEMQENNGFSVWEKSTNHPLHFESALSSYVSSSAGSSEKFAERELIGKLGNIGVEETLLNLQGMENHSFNHPRKRANSGVANFSADSAFAERAAKFSLFASRSFNGRYTNGEFSAVENPLNDKGSKSWEKPEIGNSVEEESTISGQVHSSRKRKASSKGKTKEPAQLHQETDIKNKSDSSKNKTNANGEGENSKPAEPPKDYIHVRARRGQATDSHSLAERVRREKISERMKLLQDLVPGCNKVTGKASMLDEIINYVQSLQRQVEFLSMKLATVNTMDTLASKDAFQANHQVLNPVLPVNSTASAILGLQNSDFDSLLCQNNSFQLLDGSSQNAAQYSNFCEGDLQTIVHMGFIQNQASSLIRNRHGAADPRYAPMTDPNANPMSNMKIVL